MLQRIYAHNFRCLENFEFKPEQNSTLLVGKNGAGKSTVREVLAIFQAIGRGETQVKELVKIADFTRGRTDVPMSFELDVCLDGKKFHYEIAFELPSGFKAPRILREIVEVDGFSLFSRKLADINLNAKHADARDASFRMDWHLIALPVMYSQNPSHPLENLRDWMGNMLLLAPWPAGMKADTEAPTPRLESDCNNFVAWLFDLLDDHPAAYPTSIQHLQTVIPDLDQYRFEKLGRDSRALTARFKMDKATDEQSFERLSDGEKCFFMWAALLSAIEHDHAAFIFWDEPDNFLAPHEVYDFIVAVKRSVKKCGTQWVISSHNPEAIRSFSFDSTQLIFRRSHFDPSQVRALEEIVPEGATYEELLSVGMKEWGASPSTPEASRGSPS